MGHQNVGKWALNTPQGAVFQTGPSEDQKWSKEMGGHQKIDRSLLIPELIARDDKEEARASDLDHRFQTTGPP